MLDAKSKMAKKFWILRPLRGGGVPPCPFKFFFQLYRKILSVTPRGGGTPLTDTFRDWGL